MRDIFISYASKHRIYANIVEDIISQKNYTWWRDVNNIRGGRDWHPEIELGIQECPVFIVIITQEAIKSRIVRNEIKYAKKIHKACIPLIFETFENIGIILKELGLIKKHAIDYGHLGLALGNEKLRESLTDFVDEWRPIQEAINRLQNHYSNHIRHDMVKFLADTHDFRVIPYLFTAIAEDDNDANICYIYDRLGDLDTSEVRSELVKRYEMYAKNNTDTSQEYRASILRALSKLSRSHPKIKEVFLKWLGLLNGEFTSEICHVLRESDESSRKRTIQTLLENLDVRNLDERTFEEQRLIRSKMDNSIGGLEYFASHQLVETIKQIAEADGMSQRDRDRLNWVTIGLGNSRYWA